VFHVRLRLCGDNADFLVSASLCSRHTAIVASVGRGLHLGSTSRYAVFVRLYFLHCGADITDVILSFVQGTMTVVKGSLSFFAQLLLRRVQEPELHDRLEEGRDMMRCHNCQVPQ